MWVRGSGEERGGVEEKTETKPKVTQDRFVAYKNSTLLTPTALLHRSENSCGTKKRTDRPKLTLNHKFTLMYCGLVSSRAVPLGQRGYFIHGRRKSHGEGLLWGPRSKKRPGRGGPLGHPRQVEDGRPKGSRVEFLLVEGGPVSYFRNL